MVITGSNIVDLLIAGNFSAFAVLFGAGLFFGDSDANSLGELSDGIHEGDVLVFHDETDGISGFLTAEAFKVLPRGIDVERWGFFVMKGAIRFINGAHSLEGNVGVDDVDNISCGEHLLDRFFRNSSHKAIEG